MGHAHSKSASLFARDAVPAGYVAAPYYPAPHGGWTSDWDASYQKAEALVVQMTLAEKVNITAGTGLYMGEPCVGNSGSAPRLGFPQLCFQDSPLGIRATDHNTAFPAGITTGATWDKDLMYNRGAAMGQEFKGKGANVFLGPTICPLGRKPRGGRNWEGFGADPVLQAVGAAQTVHGVQDQGVIATVKHAVGYEQEMYRMYNIIQPGYSSNIDDRTLHELYLWPFAEGIRAGAGSIMAAYNAVNGSACSQNSYLINNLLKDELGFQGFVQSDWLGQISGVASALAGLDMAMPGDTMVPLLGTSYWMYELTESVLNGSVPVDRLNDMATRVVAAWYQMHQNGNFTAPNFSSNTDDAVGLLYPGAVISPSGVVNQFVDVEGNHNLTALQIAQDGITLLKNDDNLLPLGTSTPLFVFGTDAQVNPSGPNACTDKSCNTGTLGMGWGSGTANYPYLDAPIAALQSRDTNVTYYNTDTFPSVPTPTDNDVAIVFITSDSGENSYTVEGNHGDRDASGLAAWHGGDTLVQNAAAKYSNVIVVYHTVGPVVIEPWINLTSVKAVLFAHLPGQEAGESLTNILFGTVSPSGHLPYSIPVAESDYPSSVSLTGDALGQVQDTFTEGLYVDYRYLNKNNIKPRYAFGHGLSYTNFTLTSATVASVTPLSSVPPARPTKGATPTYSTVIPAASEAYWPAGFTAIWRYLYPWLSTTDADSAYATGTSGSATYPYPAGYSDNQTANTPPPAGGAQGGNPALWDVAFTITVMVTNVGTAFSGKQVAQLYVQFPADISYDTPVIQLRDFAKTDTLPPGESEVLTLQVTRKDLSVWDVVQQNWVVPSVGGRYTLWVGDASDTLALACYTDTLTCQGGLASPV